MAVYEYTSGESITINVKPLKNLATDEDELSEWLWNWRFEADTAVIADPRYVPKIIKIYDNMDEVLKMKKLFQDEYGFDREVYYRKPNEPLKLKINLRRRSD